MFEDLQLALREAHLTEITRSYMAEELEVKEDSNVNYVRANHTSKEGGGDGAVCLRKLPNLPGVGIGMGAGPLLKRMKPIIVGANKSRGIARFYGFALLPDTFFDQNALAEAPTFQHAEEGSPDPEGSPSEADSVCCYVRRHYKFNLGGIVPPAGLPEPRAMSMAFELAQGLAEMHRDAKVPHGAIKPGNILLDSTMGQPVLSDYYVRALELLATGMRAPSPNQDLDQAYQAPEQLAGTPIDFWTPAVDVWALACVIISIVTGEPPKRGAIRMPSLHANRGPQQDVGRVVEVPTNISKGLQSLLGRMLNPKPAVRPSMGEVAADLGRLITAVNNEEASARLKLKKVLSLRSTAQQIKRTEINSSANSESAPAPGPAAQKVAEALRAGDWNTAATWSGSMGFTPLQVFPLLTDWREEAQAALFEAATIGNLPVVKVLVGSGLVDVDAFDETGKGNRNALMRAASGGHVSTVEFLVSIGRIDVDARNHSGATALFLACMGGHREVADILLGLGRANPNICNQKGASPLFIAASYDRLRVVQSLTKAGAKIDLATDDGSSPLFAACEQGFYDTAKALLDAGADKEAKHASGATPLWMSCANGHTRVARMLLDRGAKIQSKLTDGTTALFIAAQSGAEDIVRLLIDMEVDPDEQRARDQATPLWIAAYLGYQEIAAFLLRRKAKVNKQRSDGVTPLAASCRGGGDPDVTQLLISKGADPNICDNEGTSPLYTAVQNDNLDGAKLLLRAGAKVQGGTRKDGWTPLHVAAWKGHLRCVRLLLDHKASVKAINTDGAVPLYLAAQGGSAACCEALIGAGASLDARQQVGATPLMVACFKSHVEVARLLVEKGASVTAKRQDGATALHLACESGIVPLVRLLLDKGAEVNAKRKDGATPLDICIYREDPALRELVTDRGGRPGELGKAKSLLIGSGPANSGRTPLNLNE